MKSFVIFILLALLVFIGWHYLIKDNGYVLIEFLNYSIETSVPVFIGCLIVMRPYIKNVVNEVKFTYVAEEYKIPKVNKSEKTKKKIEINFKHSKKNKPMYDLLIKLGFKFKNDRFTKN